MPARSKTSSYKKYGNRRKSVSSKKERLRFKKKIFLLLSFLLAVSVLIFFMEFFRHCWDGKTKLSLVINKKDGDVLISTYDPTNQEIVNIEIPGETEVEVARHFGKWKLGSVWELSQNEGLEGKLLAETLIEHFGFPVVGWASGEAEGFAEQNLFSLIKAVVLPYKTNLSLADKLGIAFFVGRIENTRRLEVDLVETGYLSPATFVDGSEGFVKVGKFSQSILSTFADPQMSRERTRVAIFDFSGEGGAVEDVGELVETMGAKVTSIVREEKANFDCEVRGLEIKGAKKIARVFACEYKKDKLNGNSDVEMMIGEEFAQRY